MKKWLWMALLLLLIPVAVNADTIFVSPGNGTLTEALAACADGDVIELGDGVYAEPEETFPLTVTRSVTLRAAEGANPVIDAPAMKAAVRVEADGVTLEGLEIRFLRTGIYAVGSGMTVADCRILLADEAWRVSSCGMWCGGIYRMTLRGCAFTGCGIALAGPPLSERSASLPKLTGLFEVGEDPEYFTSHTIEDCTVNGRPLFYAVSMDAVTAPADAGQIIICGCGEVTVRDADVSGASMGMELAYNTRVTVENCRADRCGVFGIYVAKCTGGEVAGCTAEGSNHAMDFRADSSMTLRNCTAVNCEQAMFFSAVTGSVMTGCEASGCKAGYFVAAGSGNTLAECAAVDCENGFRLETEDGLLVTSCRAEGCTVCGMRLDRTPAIVVHNTYRNNWVGVKAYGGESLDMADNLFDGNQGCGLHLRNIGFSRLAGNRFENSGQASVIASGSMGGSVWTGNRTDIPADFSEISDGFALSD